MRKVASDTALIDCVVALTGRVCQDDNNLWSSVATIGTLVLGGGAYLWWGIFLGGRVGRGSGNPGPTAHPHFGR